MYTNSSRSYLKMASGTPWRTGGTPTAEYSLYQAKASETLDSTDESPMEAGIFPSLRPYKTASFQTRSRRTCIA